MGRSQIVLLIYILSISLACATNTTLSIENSSPYLTQNISDIEIVSGVPTLNVIDLDDYFTDDNGDTLNITHTTIQNVTITINSQNQVSFYPDSGYSGIQQMQFIVADLTTSELSNVFNLTVAPDQFPPQWSNVTKSKSEIYQSDYVEFSTIWTDNIGLSNFIFSINEAGTWTNFSAIPFSGIINTSETIIQISASPSTTVFWKFYATDMYGNINSTDVQNFTTGQAPDPVNPSEEDPESEYQQIEKSIYERMMEYSIIKEKDEAGLSVVSTSGFKTDVSSLKASLRQGDTMTKIIKLTNTGQTPLEFSVYLKELEELGIINDKTFTLQPGETKEIIIDFEIPKDMMPDQYFGTLVIKSDETLQIPIIIDIKKFEAEISLRVIILEENKKISPGEQVTATIRIESLIDIRETPFNLFYAIKDFNGNIIESGSKEIQLFKIFEEDISLPISKDILEGEYIFYARATYEDQIDLDSDTFAVSYRFKIIQFLRNSFYIFSALILLLIATGLILVQIQNKKKQRVLELYLLLTELKNLVKEGKTSEAVEVYKRIKIIYGQPIPKDFQQDKEKLKIELDKFSKLLKEEDRVQISQSTPKDPSLNKKKPQKTPKKPKQEKIEGNE